MQDNLIIFPKPPDENIRLVAPLLPVPLTSLIGREQEVQAIQVLLLRPAVNLFLQRAQAIQADFHVTRDNAALIFT